MFHFLNIFAFLIVLIDAQNDCGTDLCNYNSWSIERRGLSERWTEHPLIFPKPSCTIVISQPLTCKYDISCFPPEKCGNTSLFIRLFTISPTLLAAANFSFQITTVQSGQPAKTLASANLTAQSLQPGDVDNWNKTQFTYMDTDFWQVLPNEDLSISFVLSPTIGNLSLTSEAAWSQNPFVMDFKLQQPTSCPFPMTTYLSDQNVTNSFNITQNGNDCVYFFQSTTPNNGLLIRGGADIPRSTCDRCLMHNRINFYTVPMQFYNGMGTAATRSELGACAQDSRCHIMTTSSSIAIFLSGKTTATIPTSGIYCVAVPQRSLTLNLNIASVSIPPANGSPTPVYYIDLGEQKTFTSANFGHRSTKTNTETWQITGLKPSMFYLYMNMERTWSDDFVVNVFYRNSASPFSTFNSIYYQNKTLYSIIPVYPQTQNGIVDIRLEYSLCPNCTTISTKGLAFSILSCDSLEVSGTPATTPPPAKTSPLTSTSTTTTATPQSTTSTASDLISTPTLIGIFILTLISSIR